VRFLIYRYLMRRLQRTLVVGTENEPVVSIVLSTRLFSLLHGWPWLTSRNGQIGVIVFLFCVPSFYSDIGGELMFRVVHVIVT
jgi:hypothetical protein